MVLALLAVPTTGMVIGATTPFQQVIVVNPPASPIPVSLTGSNAISGTVNVGNLPATQAVSGTVNVGNLPATQAVSGTVELASNSTVAVVNPTGNKPLLVQEVPSTTLSAAEILPPTGNTLVGPARRELVSVNDPTTYMIFAADAPINFCITAVVLEANRDAWYQASPAQSAGWWRFSAGDHLTACETNAQYINLSNNAPGTTTTVVYRIDRLP